MIRITRNDLIIVENDYKINISVNEKIKRQIGDVLFTIESTDYLFTSKEDAIMDFIESWNSQV